MPQNIFKELEKLDQVEAIVLGGSRAGENYDKDSDYDVYIYFTVPIKQEIRKEILSKYCSYMEIGNQFWELEDDCVLKNGIEIELIYRSLDSFDKELENVIFNYQVQNSYTTCMWYNLMHSKILYDKEGRYAQLQRKYLLPYPVELKRSIISKQLLLLEQGMPAFSKQIQKAIKRQDLLSMNHRSSEFFASYFDLLFALNEQLHPGEKRMLQYAKERCTHLPKDFEVNIQSYFQSLYSPDGKEEAIKVLDTLLVHLRALVEECD